jgi:hypothetical protein
MSLGDGKGLHFDEFKVCELHGKCAVGAWNVETSGFEEFHLLGYNAV